MPININGSIINKYSVDTMDYTSIIQKDLVVNIDANSPSTGDTAIDLSDNSNDATMYNGTAVDFPGSNEYITIPDDSALDVTTAISISVWVYPDTVTGGTQGGIIAKGPWDEWPYYIQIDASDAKILWRHYVSSLSDLDSTSAISAGEWTHIACTYTSGAKKIYINGVLDASDTSTGTLDTSTGGLHIGHITDGTYYFNGKISDVKIFDTALSANQIVELYRNPNTVIPDSVSVSSLIGWWPLSEGSGTKAYDGSGNNNHGTLTNGPTWAGGQTDIPQQVGTGHSQKMVFLPNDDKVSCGDLGFSNNVSAISVSMWIRPHTITADDGGWNFEPNAGNGLSLGVYNSNYHTKIDGTIYNYAAGPANAWTHVVITYDGSYHRLYKNGVLTGSNAHTSNPDLDACNFIIGTYDNFTYYADGTFDEMAVWNIALPANDIEVLANTVNGLPNPPDANTVKSESLVGYWRNDGVGRWQDLSGNGNHGTVSGSPSQIFSPKGNISERDSQGFPSKISSFAFNETNYISVGNLGTKTNWTVSAWWNKFNRDENNIFYVGGLFGYSVWSTVYQAFYVYKSSVYTHTSTNLAYDLNRWYLQTVTHDGSTNILKTYRDGVEIDSDAIDDNADHEVFTNVKIGDGGYGKWDGTIGNFLIYDRVLSASEILQNFNTQRDRFGV